MARFEDAIDYVLGFEGDLTDHPSDPGGITHHGIILADLRAAGLAGGGDVDGDNDIDADDIRRLSEAQASELYRARYWNRLALDEINNQATATKVLDAAVVLGLSGAGKVVQRACNAYAVSVGLRHVEPLDVDGDIGPVTRARINMLERDELAGVIAAEMAGVFRLIAARNPRLKCFLAGWLRRAYSQPGNVIEWALA